MGLFGCPISRKQTNTCTARINAGVAMILVIICLFWVNLWIPMFLTIDFFFLGYLEKPSFRSSLAQKITIFLRTGKIINAGPKIFAAKIGFWAALFITVFAFKEWIIAYYIAAGILCLATAAEALFEFCIGCKLFAPWMNFKDKLFR